MVQNDAAKRRAVGFDQLAGQEHEAGRVGPERRPARPKERGDLGREALRADLEVERLLDLDDAGLGRIGDDEPQIARDADLQEPVPLSVGVERDLHGRHDAPVDRLAAVDAAAQQHRIEIVLLFQQGRDALRQRLGDGDAAAKGSLFVGDVDHPVDEGAQKIAVADLQDLDRARRGVRMGDALEVRRQGAPGEDGHGLARGHSL